MYERSQYGDRDLVRENEAASMESNIVIVDYYTAVFQFIIAMKQHLRLSVSVPERYDAEIPF